MESRIISQLKILKLIEIKPNFSELSRIYGCDRRTIKKYYDGYEGKPSSRNKTSYLDKYAEIIKTKLAIKCSTVRAVYEYIKTEVDERIGTYSNFNKYVKAKNLVPKSVRKGHPRFETPLGYQAQVDCKEDITLINKDFDFSYQPSINKDQIMDLMTLRFMETKSNVIFIGSSGVGKTHLATAIGIEAASQRISTYFVNFSTLMAKFKQAAKENRVEKIVKHYLKYTVLIIDEIGYLPIDREASYGFFQLVAARYEKRPTILTTNQSFSKWPEVFGDAVISNAIIDRLVHHCEIIKITGHSYRIKDRNIFEEEE